MHLESVAGRWSEESALDLKQIASGLDARGDGIWHAAGSEPISYPAEGNEQCFGIEEQSFWFGHRNACITALIDAWPPTDTGPVFDIGGGNGYVAKAILDSGREVVVVEPGVAGARNAKSRGLPLVVCASLEAAGFARDCLSAAGLFDVVEHIEDDVAFLRTVQRLLKPRGRLYVTVPAYRALWSHHDVAAGHFRRYTLASLRRRLEAAGFAVDYATYVFRPLPLPILLFRALPERLGLRGPDTARQGGLEDHKVSNPMVKRLLGAAFRSEITNIRRRRPMRFGGSCLIAASKG